MPQSTCDLNPFPFRRGSNMGLWLSQANVLDEQHLAGFYRREHIARLARTGADHLRLPVDHVYCTEFGCWDPAPRESQLNWFRDSLRLFAAHDVAWAQWEYGCLFERDGRPKPPLGVLLSAPPPLEHLP